MYNRIRDHILKWALNRTMRRSLRRDMSRYDVTPDLIASLAQHPGFRFLCAHLENTKAMLEARRGARREPPKGVDDAVAFACEAAALDAEIYRIGWLQRQVVNAGAAVAEFASPEADSSR